MSEKIGVNWVNPRLALLYKEEENNIEILRVYADVPEVDLSQVNDILIAMGLTSNCMVRMSDYCFAEKARLSNEAIEVLKSSGLSEDTGENKNLISSSPVRPLSGSYLEKIVLPDSVKSLGDYCFYNCRALREISVSGALSEIGSDAFMNCKGIKKIKLRASVKEKTGLMQILAQIPKEVEIEFEEGTFLFPEFTESYDLIGPAHIFSLNLQGEGYRARKQFIDGVFDINGYDKIFAKACNEEKFDTLMKMAVNRLKNSYGLADDARSAYEKYIADNEKEALKRLVTAGEEDAVMSLLRSGIISDTGRQAAVEAAVARQNMALVTRIIAG